MIGGEEMGARRVKWGPLMGVMPYPYMLNLYQPTPPAVSAPYIAIFTNWFYTCYDPESEDWFRVGDFHNQFSNIPHQEAVAVDTRRNSKAGCCVGFHWCKCIRRGVQIKRYRHGNRLSKV